MIFTFNNINKKKNIYIYIYTWKVLFFNLILRYYTYWRAFWVVNKVIEVFKMIFLGILNENIIQHLVFRVQML
jgi:hypothetical protein